MNQTYPSLLNVNGAAVQNHLDALYRISSRAGGLDAGVRLNAAGAEVAEYLRQQWEQAGASHVCKSEFRIKRWWPEEYKLALIGDGGDVVLNAFPLWYCTAFGPGDLELIDGGCGTRGELRGKNIRGKAVLVRMRRIFHFIPTFEKLGTLKHLAAKGAAAVIVVDDLLDTPSGMLSLTHREVMDWKEDDPRLFPLPAFSIGRSDGQYLLNRSAAGQVRVRLYLKTSLTETTACNVTGHIPGNGQSNEMILAGGHYDTWFGGALDNLASQAAMIEMIRYLAALPIEKRPRSFMLAAIFGHEIGNQGHAALAAELATLRDRITCFVDIDGSGSAGWEVDHCGRIVETGLNDVCGIVASSNALARLAYTALYEQRIFSFRLTNNMQIADLDGPLTELGIPTLLVIGKHLFYHSPLDTPDRIPLDILQRRTAVNLRIILELMASAPGYYQATNTNPFRRQPAERPYLPDLQPDDVPFNSTPWTDGPPRDLLFEVFPAQPKIFSPVIVWRGHAVSEGINRGDDIRWHFGSMLERFAGTPGRGGASGTMYLTPGHKVIRMTVTDRHGRSRSVERRIRVTCWSGKKP
jgi:hypothetical protein